MDERTMTTVEVLGQRDADGRWSRLGHYLARDGSQGQPVALDMERPHAGLVVGKRGSGKSHTLGVVAEGIARTAGIGGIVVDPMGGLTGLAEDPNVTAISTPRVDPGALPARTWCSLLDLDPAEVVGGLVWRSASTSASLQSMRSWIADADAPTGAKRAATNHLRLAEGWGIFDQDGIDGSDLLDEAVVVLNLAGHDDQPSNAILRAISDGLYEASLSTEVAPLQWVIVDEAHVFFDGVADRGIRRVLTRGRQPGLSVLAATQRPDALPSVAISQADLIVAHRLTAAADVASLSQAQQTYHHHDVADRLPAVAGNAVVLDDETESMHTVSIRDRRTPHGGRTPRATGREHSEDG